MSSDAAAPAACPRCGTPLEPTTVRTVFWPNDRPVIVEDIPAQVCNACVDQFYDEGVSNALRRLADEGFPASQAQREVVVPVFSLGGRVRERAPLPEDTYID